jgi:hypothetical protein
MKELVDQAFVSEDSPHVKSRWQHNDKKRGGVPASGKESAWLAGMKEAKQEMDSGLESELENLSILDCEGGIGKRDQ